MIALAFLEHFAKVVSSNLCESWAFFLLFTSLSHLKIWHCLAGDKVCRVFCLRNMEDLVIPNVF